MLRKSEAGFTDCEGSKSYHRMTVVCYFPNCLYKIWLNFVDSYFINPNIFAVACYWRNTHYSLSRATEEPGPDPHFWPAGPREPHIPPPGFSSFPSHNLTIDLRYINSVFALFLFHTQEYSSYDPKAVGASEHQLAIHPSSQKGPSPSH